MFEKQNIVNDINIALQDIKRWLDNFSYTEEELVSIKTGLLYTLETIKNLTTTDFTDKNKLRGGNNV